MKKLFNINFCRTRGGGERTNEAPPPPPTKMPMQPPPQPTIVISDTQGELALQRKGIHELLSYRCLTGPNGDIPTLELVHFVPKENVDRAVGRGLIKHERFSGKDDVDKKMKGMVVGPKWQVDVSAFFPFVTNVDNRITEGNFPLYSCTGDSLESSAPLCGKKEVDNCFTFVRDLVLEYHQELGITEDLTYVRSWSWVPAQSPYRIHDSLKKKQLKKQRKKNGNP